MGTKPTINGMDILAGAHSRLPIGSVAILSDYWALTKPEVNTLIAVATFAGLYFGYPGRLSNSPFWSLIHSLAGTLLVASGTATLNQYLERRFDAQMRRTTCQPLAAGRLRPESPLRFGILLSVAGGIYLVEDYARAGLSRSSRGERKGEFVVLGSVLALLLVSIAPTLLGRAGPLYAIAALVLASAFLSCGIQLAVHRSNAAAKRLLFASIIYVPLAFAFMMIAKS